MPETERITPQHPLYERILQRYREYNGTVIFNGKHYMPLQDNDQLVFVQTQSTSGFDSAYDQSTFGRS